MSTPIAPVPNPASQLERALIAYMQQCLTGAWQADGTFVLQSIADVQSGTAGQFGFYFSNDWKTRQLPLYEFLAHSTAENPPHSRNEDCEVTITCEWKGNNVAGEASDTNWRAINDQVGYVMAAMSMSNDAGQTYKLACSGITAAGRWLATVDPTNNADMARFTCTSLIYKGAMRARIVDGSMVIMEKRNFTIRAVPENVD